MTAAIVDAARRRLHEIVATRRRTANAGTGESYIVGLVGRGIQASRTPHMHEREGRRIGVGYAYVLIDFDELQLSDSHLGEMVLAAEQMGFAGINVTHPFKQAILNHLDDLAPEAASIGAVNTLVFASGRRIGHNTDCWGFAESFRTGLAGVNLDQVVQFGAGGAGAAVGHALLSLGVERLGLFDTEPDRARLLAQRLAERFGGNVGVVADIDAELAVASGMVNTTPVGMAKYPGLPLPGHALRPELWVAEIVYFPEETALLLQARALGCRTLAGTGMAVFQAVKAFELFTGIAPDRDAMSEHFRSAA